MAPVTLAARSRDRALVTMRETAPGSLTVRLRDRSRVSMRLTA